jgi:hypothetical protein
MECDGHKKVLVKDLDGTLIGAVGSIIPQSQWEWDGDPRRGLGDYRIPKTMLSDQNGDRLSVQDIAPRKGKPHIYSSYNTISFIEAIENQLHNQLTTHYFTY